MRKVRSIQKVPFLAPDVLTKVIPSPTDGWDAISPLAEMDPKRAVTLNNWVPRPGFIELRGGYLNYGYINTAVPVEALMVYRSATTEKLFAAVANVNGVVLYDASPGGLLTSATGFNLGTGRLQYTNFTPAGGATHLQACNGATPLLDYNGTAWTQPSITGLPVGFTSASIINIFSDKHRLWYILNQSTEVAFMPTDAITGPIAGTLDFGAEWSKGGYLVAGTKWTIDGGTGPQDYAAFISSQGQITIYSGTDPTDANNWTLVGTFNIAPPIGRRCFLGIGSDVGIITTQGVLPISQVLPFDPSADRSVAITARIQNAMSSAAQLASGNFGWQLISYANQQLILLNVPLTENSSQVQYVMNALTGAWCQFTGWNANCFEIYLGDLYFGDNKGFVNKAYVGGSDMLTAIPAQAQCAYNWFDEPGRTKRITMLQPLMVVGGGLSPTIAVDADFINAPNGNYIAISAPTSSVTWDSAHWDVDSWPSTTAALNNWISISQIGHALAVDLKISVNTTTNSGALGVFDYGTFDHAVFDAGVSTTLPTAQLNAANCIYESGAAI